LTRGVYQEISAGVSAKDALNEITEAAKAAAGGQADLYDTVNLGTTVWNVYGQAAQNMTHVYDVMWQVVKDGKSNMAQLSSYFGEFIPMAKEAGLTLEEASGALAIMSQISGKVNISVTQLKAIMQGVIKPTKEAADEAQRIGVNFSTAAIKTMGFEAWLRNLLDAVQKNNGDMSKLFGSVEGLSGILQLSRNNLKNFNDEMIKMGQVAGNNQENFEKYRESLKGSWEEIKNRVQAVLIQVILPLMKEVAKWVRENSDNIMSFVKNFISGFRIVIGFIVQFKDVIILAGKAWLTYFAVSKILPVLSQMKAGIFGVTNALNTMNTVTQAGNLKTMASFGGMVNYMKSYQSQVQTGNAALLQIMGSSQNAIANTNKGLGGMVQYMQSSQSAGTRAFDAVKNSVNGLNDKLSALPTAVKVGLGAVAFQIGYEIGRWINEILELEKHVARISKYEIKMAFAASAYKAGFIDLERQSKAFIDKQEKEIEEVTKKFGIHREELYRNANAFNSLSDSAQRYFRSQKVQDIESIRALGKELEIHSTRLSDISIGILENGDAINRLGAVAQDVVRGLGGSHKAMREELKNVASELKIPYEQAYDALNATKERVRDLKTSMGQYTEKELRDHVNALQEQGKLLKDQRDTLIAYKQKFDALYNSYPQYIEFAKMLGSVIQSSTLDILKTIENLIGNSGEISKTLTGIGNLFLSEFAKGKKQLEDHNAQVKGNIDLYNNLKATVGSYTTEALDKELERLKEHGKLNEEQVKTIQELKKSYESLAGELGVLTRDGYGELIKKTNLISTMWAGNESFILSNKKSLEAMGSMIFDIIKKYQDAGKKIPPILEEIKAKIVAAQLAEAARNTELKEQLELQAYLDEQDFAKYMKEIGEAHLEAAHATAENDKSLEKLNQTTIKVITENERLKDSFDKIGGEAIGILNAVGNSLTSLGLVSEEGGNKINSYIGYVEGNAETIKGILTGDISSIINGIIKSTKNLFALFSGGSGELEAAERILRGLGDAAAGYAQKIEELAKQYRKAGMKKGSAERAFGDYMAEIFGNMASTEANFNQIFQKMMDYGAAVQWAGISLDEASKNYGEAFTEMLRVAEETGQIGSDKFLYIIENADKLGLKCKEITEYVESKTQSAFEGWQKATKAFGDIDIPIFKSMQRELDIIASIPPEIMEGIEGLTQSVIDYSSAHKLLPKEFAAYNSAASTAINQLKNQHKTNEEIAIAMAPLIQKLAFLQQEFGFEVDATTQEIIDQAKKMGLLEGDYRDSNQIMKDGFGEVTIAIRELSSAIRGDFCESFSTAAIQVRTSSGIMIDQLSRVKGSVKSTNDEIKAMGANIKGVDSDFVRSISGNTIMIEIYKMQGGIRGTIDLTQVLGQAIIPVHEKWINSSKAMQTYLEGIQDRIKELQDLIEAYGDNLTELQEQEKAQYEAELEQLEALLEAREAALGISEELNSIQFDADSFADGIWSIYEVFNALENGIITTQEAADELGDSFNVMIGKAKALGVEGSASLLQFMRDVKASGLDVPEIKAYKADQLSGGNKALSDYLSTFADTAAIRANIADLENELKRARGARRQELQLEILEQKDLLNQGIEDIKNNAQSMGIYTLGMFSSMIENGATYMEAMKEMGPQLSQLKKLYQEAGIEVSGPLKEMLDMQEFIEQQGTLADRISASTKMLQALGNTGNLTKEIFDQFQVDLTSQFDELVGNTGDRKKTLQLLAPELAKMLWYSEQNEGLTLDPKIQEMIAEATRQGIDLKAMLPAQEQMVGHLQELVAIEKDILNALTKPTPPPYLAYPSDYQKTPPLSAAAGIRFIVPPGYEDIKSGFPMLVHTGELVQVFPPEETSRIMDYFNYQPIFDQPKENRPAGDSPSGITIYNIFRDDEDEEDFTGTIKTPGSITGTHSQGNETIEINIPIEKIQVTFEPKTGATLPKDDDLEEFSRKFKKVIVDDVRQAASVAAAEIKRRMR
jgi:TP901 family phage tail tape measure protein